MPWTKIFTPAPRTVRAEGDDGTFAEIGAGPVPGLSNDRAYVAFGDADSEVYQTSEAGTDGSGPYSLYTLRVRSKVTMVLRTIVSSFFRHSTGLTNYIINATNFQWQGTRADLIGELRVDSPTLVSVKANTNVTIEGTGLTSVTRLGAANADNPRVVLNNSGSTATITGKQVELNTPGSAPGDQVVTTGRLFLTLSDEVVIGRGVFSVESPARIRLPAPQELTPAGEFTRRHDGVDRFVPLGVVRAINAAQFATASITFVDLPGSIMAVDASSAYPRAVGFRYLITYSGSVFASTATNRARLQIHMRVRTGAAFGAWGLIRDFGALPPVAVNTVQPFSVTDIANQLVGIDANRFEIKLMVATLGVGTVTYGTFTVGHITEINPGPQL